MNKVILCGRLTRDPEVRWANGPEQICIARYSIAVDRKGQKREGEPSADFINCTAFRKNAEFTEKYLKKGTKIMITGHLQTGSYTDRDGKRIYTTDVIVEESEFAESKAAGQQNGQTFAGDFEKQEAAADPDGFMMMPDSIDDEGLPFN